MNSDFQKTDLSDLWCQLYFLQRRFKSFKLLFTYYLKEIYDFINHLVQRFLQKKLTASGPYNYPCKKLYLTSLKEHWINLWILFMLSNNCENISHSINKLVSFDFFRFVSARGTDYEICKSNVFFFCFYLMFYTFLCPTSIILRAIHTQCRLSSIFSWLLIRVQGVFLDSHLFFEVYILKVQQILQIIFTWW